MSNEKWWVGETFSSGAGGRCKADPDLPDRGEPDRDQRGRLTCSRGPGPGGVHLAVGNRYLLIGGRHRGGAAGERARVRAKGRGPHDAEGLIVALGGATILRPHAWGSVWASRPGCGPSGCSNVPSGPRCPCKGHREPLGARLPPPRLGPCSNPPPWRTTTRRRSYDRFSSLPGPQPPSLPITSPSGGQTS